MPWNPYARLTDGTYREPHVHGPSHEWVSRPYNRDEAETLASQFSVPICHETHGTDTHFHPCTTTTKPCPVHAYLREHTP